MEKIFKSKNIKIGDVASYCCCRDMFIIENQEMLNEVIENLSDKNEELKYMVVSPENAYVLCGCSSDEKGQKECQLVKDVNRFFKESE